LLLLTIPSRGRRRLRKSQTSRNPCNRYSPALQLDRKIWKIRWS